MTAVMNPYDALYTNLKNRFTVIHDSKECTVGDFMLMKAGKATAPTSAVAVVVPKEEHHALATIATFVGDKLTVKTPPVKDKTIRRFPLRTSASALLSSVASCALVFAFGVIALTSGNEVANLSAEEDSSYTESYTESGETVEDEVLDESYSE